MATPKKSPKSAKSDTPAAAASTQAATPAKAADKPAVLAPVVNLNQAAQSAAALLAARAKRTATPAETSDLSHAAFKQLKAGIGQTQHASSSPLAGLNRAAKPNAGAGLNRQVGHHQTFGANVARTGVPRRTSGG